MALVWSSELSVGNAVIDSEHRNLIVMVVSLESAIKAKDSSSLAQELEQVEYWLCAHFKNEKRIAAAVGFDPARIEAVHRKLLEEFHCMRDRLNALSSMWSDRVAKQCYQRLSEWVTGHIVDEDMQMKPVLKAHEYNFCG